MYSLEVHNDFLTKLLIYGYLVRSMWSNHPLPTMFKLISMTTLLITQALINFQGTPQHAS